MVGTRVAVALGSNLGDRIGHLRAGLRGLASFVEGPRCSPVYETEPLHLRDQPRFLNACCVGRTTLAPPDLLRRLQGLERAAGPRPLPTRFGPRPLDLDLLLYGDLVVREPGIRVPHPRMLERAFVLVPLADVAPAWVHPEAGAPVGELADRLSAAGVRPWRGAIREVARE